MGAKTAILAYADSDPREVLRGRPTLDRAAALALVGRVFPGRKVEQVFDGSLDDGYPEEGIANAGCFPGLELVCERNLQIDRPSQLDPRLLQASAGRRLYLHMMHSMVDWAAFALWEDTRLIRSLSLAPDTGVVENVGAPLPFEAPFWPASTRTLTPTRTIRFRSARWAWARRRCGRSSGSSTRACRDPGDLDPSEIALVGVRLRPPPPRPRAPRPA